MGEASCISGKRTHRITPATFLDKFNALQTGANWMRSWVKISQDAVDYSYVRRFDHVTIGLRHTYCMETMFLDTRRSAVSIAMAMQGDAD